ncbi:MAG: macro domain-containing protein, partial [Anaerolineaceae bacterium]|nr:macro domain-containing protein [Anaerolineaceae bacterium]
VWGEGDEDDKLIQAIQGSLQLAEKLQATSISFPAISTGIFSFPVERAADIFMQAFSDFNNSPHAHSINKIIVVLFDRHSLAIFARSFDRHFGLG